MPQTTILLQVRSQPGLLMRLVMALASYDLWVDGHNQQPPDAKGVSQLVLTLNGSRSVDVDVRTALLAIEGVIQCLDGIIELKPSGKVLNQTELQQLLRATFAQIERAFPNILMLVRDFANDLATDQRQRALHALGRQLGRRKYRAQYAEGSPLPLAQALTRIVAPVFRPITNIEIHADTVTVPGGLLCDTRPGSLSSCAFFAGLMQGLLEDSPATRGATVSVVSCRAKSQASRNACVCGIRLAAH